MKKYQINRMTIQLRRTPQFWLNFLILIPCAFILLVGMEFQTREITLVDLARGIGIMALANIFLRWRVRRPCA